MRDAVWDFAAGAEQYDDLTLLAFRRAPLPEDAGAAASRGEVAGEPAARA